MYSTGLFQTGRTALCGCQLQPRRLPASTGRRCLTVKAATTVPAQVMIANCAERGLQSAARRLCVYLLTRLSAPAVQNSFPSW